MWGRCDGAIFSLTVCGSFGYSLVVLLIGCFAHFGRQKSIEIQCAARPPCVFKLVSAAEIRLSNRGRDLVQVIQQLERLGSSMCARRYFLNMVHT